ncbi:MAG: hypothetical protein ACRDZV_06780, partial [Acidimicrobiia bacterium]
MGGRSWARFLLAGLCVAAVAAVIGGPVSAVVIQLTGWTAIVVPLVRMRTWSGRQRLPWLLCAAAGGLFLLGSITRFVHAGLAGVDEPFPS